jgi:hypothetical protein
VYVYTCEFTFITHTHSNQLIILSINDPMVNFVSIDVTLNICYDRYRKVTFRMKSTNAPDIIFRLARAKANRRVETRTRVLNSEKIIILDKDVQPDSDA